MYLCTTFEQFNTDILCEKRFTLAGDDYRHCTLRNDFCMRQVIGDRKRARAHLLHFQFAHLLIKESEHFIYK